MASGNVGHLEISISGNALPAIEALRLFAEKVESGCFHVSPDERAILARAIETLPGHLQTQFPKWTDIEPKGEG